MAGCEQFLDVMANMCGWKGSELPDKVGAIKLQQFSSKAGTTFLEKVVKKCFHAPRSTVVVEPMTSRSTSRDIMVRGVVTPLLGDRFASCKSHQLVSDKPVILKRNRKLADSCVLLQYSVLKHHCKQKTLPL